MWNQSTFTKIILLLKVLVLVIGSCVIIVNIPLAYDLAVQKLTLAQSDLLIRFFEIFFSFPLVAIMAITLFHKELRELINRVKGFKALGTEFEISQLQKVEEAKNIEEKLTEIEEDKTNEMSEEQIEELKRSYAQNSHELNANKEFIQHLLKNNDYLLQRSESYEFLYLNYFLVENSKRALLWFNYQGITNRAVFINSFILQFPKDSLAYQYDPALLQKEHAEKNAILEVLLGHELIQYIGADLTITGKGVKFLRFLGIENNVK